MNEKQQQLTFDKGITNVPNDFTCSDNALQDCVGMTFAGGEHKVIQKPSLFMEGCDYDILFIHKYNLNERYIVTNGQKVGWGYKNGSEQFVFSAYLPYNTSGQLSYSDETRVTAIGRTLIISDGENIFYYLWRVDQNDYYELGDIPEPNIEFSLTYLSESSVVNTSTDGILTTEYQGAMVTIIVGQQSAYNDLAVGQYDKCVKDATSRKAFCKPFFIRYAIELFDGSYTKVSNPILLFPSVSQNFYSIFDATKKLVYSYVYNTKLIMKADFDYSYWDDIVKNVVVFASDGVELYKREGDHAPLNTSGTEVWDSIYATVTTASQPSAGSRSGSKILTKGNSTFHSVSQQDPTENDRHLTVLLEKRTKDDIQSDLEAVNIFYKIFEIGKAGTNEWEFVDRYIETNTLENLTTQLQLTDDYYSHCPLSANSITSYNSRLLLSNVRRGFFSGFASFMPYDNASTYIYRIWVYIKTPSGTRHIKKEYTTKEKVGLFFYYPDPRAYQVDIFLDNGGLVASLNLKEHPYLNGAYYIKGLPDGTEPEPTTPTVAPQPSLSDNKEILANLLYVSEVNNPFVFRPEGNVTVGNGEIVGVSSQTTALSQGQFGQYPLIIFTTEGIWAASTSSTGLFSAVHPMSREVCNNAKSITQTDGLIFFSSEKGLMVVSGSVVKCVSEQLNGKSDTPFQDFLKTAVIAYDYRDSLLWIFDAATHQEGGVDVVGSNYCYIYNIKSSSFSRYILDGEVTMKGEAVAHFETFSSLQTHLSELGLTAGDLVLLDSSAGYYESFETEEHIGAPVPTVMEYNAPAPDFTWNIYFPSANEAYLVGNTIWAVTGEEEWRTIRRIRNVVSDYPDFLLQSGDSVLTLLKRPNINSDDTEYFTKITSRPAKLENSLALKTIMQLKNIKQIQGNLTLTIEASNDIEHWVEITSLTGIPWKFYRFTYEFSNLKATDTFSGTVLITQERRTNKLR